MNNTVVSFESEHSLAFLFVGPFIYYVMPSEGGRELAKPADHNTLLHKLHNKGGGGSQKQEKKP